MALVTETVRYSYRLRPGATAERALLDEWGRCRWLWNEAVHQQRAGRRPAFSALSKMLTAARKENSWLRDGSQNAQQQMLRTYAAALGASFSVRGRGRPTHKRRDKSLPSLEYTLSGRFSIRQGRLTLPKGISIPVVWSRDLPSKPTSVRVTRDSLGHWYASFVVRRDRAEPPRATASIGVDWGVRVTATTTDPAYDLPYAGHRARCAAELARAQRKMARRKPRPGQKSSKGYQRARRQVARIHKKAARQSQHTARVWSNSVVADHQVIAIEDFRSRFLSKSRMARKAADAAISGVKRELIQAGKRAGREVVLVPPAYTTMTCSTCGTRTKDRLELSQRVFRCESCGYVACRDRNAARTILATAEQVRAGVDVVSHGSAPLGVAADVSAESETFQR